MEILAFVLAFVSAVMAYGGSAMQAFEARQVPRAQSLRAGLLLALLRRPLWLGGTGLNVVAFGVQVIALALASLAVVQPTLALGLVVLVAIAVWKLDEDFEIQTAVGIGAVIAGLVGLAFVAPKRNHLPDDAASISVVCVALVVVVGVLALMRVLDRRGGLAASLAAGLSYAWLALSGALFGEAFTHRDWALVALWALAIVVAAVLAVTAEMTALQSWPVSRSKPVVFVLQTLIPAFVAPFFSTRGFGPFHGVPFAFSLVVVSAGAAVVAASGAVASTQA
jgi:hypothetical protein